VVVASQAPAIASVVNAGSALPTAASPGLIVTIYGSNLGPAQGVSARVAGDTLETMVAETRVLFDGIPAPLVYVRANQVNAIVPYAVSGKPSTQLQVEYRGVRSSSMTLVVADAAPGVFTLNNQGIGQAAVINQDDSINSIVSPAARNSVVLLFATGEGQTTPAGVDGKVAATPPYPAPVLPVKVTIGGKAAEVLYAGAAPGFVAGAMQINARIPSDAPNGDAVPVTITVGSRSSQPGVSLSVR